MDKENSLTETVRFGSTPGRFPGFAIITLLLGFLILPLVYPWLSSRAGGSDSSGYVNYSRFLREGHLTAPLRIPPGKFYRATDPQLWHSLGFDVFPGRNELVPSYSSGLPLQFAATTALFGLKDGIRLVQLTVFFGSFVLMVLLCRQLGIGRFFALAAGFTLIGCTLFFMMGVQCMSDSNATFWALAVITSAVAAVRRSEVRGTLVFAAIAGFSLGISVLTRAPSALLILPVIVLWGLRWELYLGLAFGGIPSATFYFWSNKILFGHYIASGYMGLSSLFKLAYFVPNLGHIVYWTTALLSPVVALGLLFCFDRRVRKIRLTLALWLTVLVYFVFYSFYFYTGETWWYLRFVLPAFPVLIALGFCGWSRLVGGLLGRGKARSVAGYILGIGVIVGISVSHLYWMHRFKPYNTSRGEAKYEIAGQWVRNHVPPDALIFCMQVSGSTYCYTPNPILRWDVGPPKATEAILRHATEVDHFPIYAILFPFENQQIWKRFPRSDWKLVGHIQDLTVFEYKPAS